MNDLKLGIVQMCSTSSVTENLEKMESALFRMAENGADLVVFPEYCTCLGGFFSTRNSAKSHNEWCEILGDMARNAGVAAVFGGINTRLAENDLRNRSMVLDKRGQMLAFYDKNHLFPLKSCKNDAMDEIALFTPGKDNATFDFNGWKIGLSICFDLRFPEFYAKYRGCHLLLCTAAFTRATGQVHWLPLLHARAIEAQAWFVGVGQGGDNVETGAKLYGASAVYDPWGTQQLLLPACGAAMDCINIQIERVLNVRRKLYMGE